MIELELGNLEQLNNSFDPAPFHEKELNPDADEYIYNAVDEFPLKKPLEIMIHLPPNEVSTEIEVNLTRAIRNHHLRSTREVMNYNIHASDGEIGHIEDFIINTEKHGQFII